MPFFSQRQNNSGGHYIGPQIVIIEADTEEKALKKFKSKKRRFRKDAESWCECCGERWLFYRMDRKHDALEEAFVENVFFYPDEHDFGLLFMKNKEVYTFGPGEKSDWGRKVDPGSLTLIDKNDPRVTG